MTIPDTLDRKTLVAAVNVLLFSVIVAGTIAKYFVLEGANPPRVGVTLAVILGLNGLYLQRGGSPKKAAQLIVIALYVGFTVAGARTGGFNSPIIYVAPILPVLSVLLLDRSVGLIGLLAIVLSLLVLAFAQYFGLTDSILLGETGVLITNFSVMLCSCLVTSWIVWDFARKSNESAEANLRNANTDFLTGLANRRKITETLEEEVKRTGRSDGWLSLILIDVDHFKRYNDSSGHQAGDECLVTVANVITSFAMRSVDVAGRFGGDEFILILPNTDSSAACDIADKIRRQMQNRKSPDGFSDQLSLTLGVVSLSGEAIESPEGIIQLADRALYHGKAQGGGCVVNTLIDAQTGLPSFECQ
jgi:diguanylate cyclase (GGDEF)-like protein|tara:strand:+ start:300 stop:1379 length:1080 start_codon:yes stop_codon:yes gene_type:complete